MKRFLYGDQGSEHLIYNDGAKAADLVTRYYHATTSLVVGFDRPSQDRDVYYCTRIYNSRGGGLTSGCEYATNDTMPADRLAAVSFHSIGEFEAASRSPSHTFGGMDVIRPTEAQAKAVLQRLTEALMRGGERRVILTLGDWNGSEEGFLQTALAHLRGLLCVLPHRLQRYVTFAINTAPAGPRASAHTPLLCFQRTGHPEAIDLTNVGEAPYCAPWIVGMAKAAADGSGCSLPDDIEAAIRLPYMTGRPLPIELYAQLDSLCGQMAAGHPDAETIKAAWMQIRDEERLDKEVFLKAAAASYPTEIVAMLTEVEAAIQEEEAQAKRIADALRADKAEVRERIEALAEKIRNADQSISTMNVLFAESKNKLADLEADLFTATRAIETLRQEEERLRTEIAEKRETIRRREAEQDAREAAAAARARRMGEGFIWDDRKPYESANRYVDFLSDHLAKERPEGPSGHRLGTSYPSNKYPPGNHRVSVGPLNSKVLAIVDLEKNSTIDERIHRATIALILFFRDRLSDAMKWSTFQYFYCKGEYGCFNISTTELVFPMLALIHLYHEKTLPTPMREKLERQSGTDIQEHMLYHAMVLFSMMLGRGETWIGARARELVKASRIAELLDAIVRLFPDPEKGMELLDAVADMMVIDARIFAIVRKEMRG